MSADQDVKAAYQAAVDSQSNDIKTLEKQLAEKDAEIALLRQTILTKLPDDPASFNRTDAQVERDLLQQQIENLRAGSELLVHAAGEADLEVKRLRAVIERKRTEQATIWEAHEKQFAHQRALMVEALTMLHACRDLLFATHHTPKVGDFLDRPDIAAIWIPQKEKK